MAKSKSTPIRIDHDIAIALKDLAEQTGLSVRYLASKALKHYLDTVIEAAKREKLWPGHVIDKELPLHFVMEAEATREIPGFKLDWGNDTKPFPDLQEKKNESPESE